MRSKRENYIKMRRRNFGNSDLWMQMGKKKHSDAGQVGTVFPSFPSSAQHVPVLVHSS